MIGLEKARKNVTKTSNISLVYQFIKIFFIHFIFKIQDSSLLESWTKLTKENNQNDIKAPTLPSHSVPSLQIYFTNIHLINFLSYS